MTVRRIISKFATGDIAAAKRFYQHVLRLEVLIDHGWIATQGSQQQMTVADQFRAESGSRTAVPDLSIGVDDVDEVLHAMKAAFRSNGPVDQLGVRRL